MSMMATSVHSMRNIKSAESPVIKVSVEAVVKRRVLSLAEFARNGVTGDAFARKDLCVSMESVSRTIFAKSVTESTSSSPSAAISAWNHVRSLVDFAIRGAKGVASANQDLYGSMAIVSETINVTSAMERPSIIPNAAITAPIRVHSQDECAIQGALKAASANLDIRGLMASVERIPSALNTLIHSIAVPGSIWRSSAPTVI